MKKRRVHKKLSRLKSEVLRRFQVSNSELEDFLQDAESYGLVYDKWSKRMILFFCKDCPSLRKHTGIFIENYEDGNWYIPHYVFLVNTHTCFEDFPCEDIEKLNHIFGFFMEHSGINKKYVKMKMSTDADGDIVITRDIELSREGIIPTYLEEWRKNKEFLSQWGLAYKLLLPEKDISKAFAKFRRKSGIKLYIRWENDEETMKKAIEYLKGSE